MRVAIFVNQQLFETNNQINKKIMRLSTITIALAAALMAVAPVPAKANEWAPAGENIKTRWAADVTPDNVWKEYPRPQLERKAWQSLNGLWEYSVQPVECESMDESAQGSILVPFAIESSLSGVGRKLEENQALWYRRTVEIPQNWKGQNVILHFDAVDWDATLWVNGTKVTRHTGGYTAFSADITPYLQEGAQTIVLKVLDPGDDGHRPVGKQTRNPGGIWYTSVSGIWQSVWMEPVSAAGNIEDYKVLTDIKEGTITLFPKLNGVQDGDKLKVKLTMKGRRAAKATVQAGDSIVLKLKNPELWTPENPALYDFTIKFKRGLKTLDKVKGYTAMREIGVKADALGHKRLALNGEIYFQYGPLDQGWWPDGLYTAPTDEALRFDLEQTKEYGFNMIRKHIKVEPARWYMWCDRLGIIVWQDMPSCVEGGNPYVGGRWSQKVYNEEGRNYYDSGEDSKMEEDAVETYRKEWKEIIDQRDKFQCIAVWVPFNEGWAQFNTVEIVEYTRSLDPTRLINGASGGNWVKGQMGDILDSHYYPMPKMRIIDSELVNVLGEYGGIGLPLDGHTWDIGRKWGYIKYETPEEVTEQYLAYSKDLLQIVQEGCAAAVYTQTTDVEGEVNGLMTYDREVLKLDVEKVREANQRIIEAGSSELVLISQDEFLEGSPKDCGCSLQTLRGGDLVMQVTSFGGRVVSLWAPDQNGRYADVEVGHKRLCAYVDYVGERFLGSSPGPVANRVGGAAFSLNGNTYKLSANDNGNTLHGGFKGIDMLPWEVVELTDSSVLYKVVHPDGLDGFPGNTTIFTKYTLTSENEFKVDFTATSDKDTPVNLAHHSFFNLCGIGNGSVLGHILQINASANTPVDDKLIPTGAIESLEGTPRDFREPRAIGDRVDDYDDVQMAYGHGYDHNFVLDRETESDMELVATCLEPESGRFLEVFTDQPGLQFYSGYFFDGTTKDKYGVVLDRNCSLALETQKFPDAVNHPEFPDTILKAGETYTHSCIYRLTVKK